jgi:hypothetical protein
MSKLRNVCAAAGLAVLVASPVWALGSNPGQGGGGNGGGTIATPAPIAGAGIVWLGIAGGAYVIHRMRRRKD